MSMIMRRVVVLPAPFGPSRPQIDPGATASETPATATKSPKLLRTSRSSRVDGMELQSM